MVAPVTGRLETFLFAIIKFPILVQLRYRSFRLSQLGKDIIRFGNRAFRNQRQRPGLAGQSDSKAGCGGHTEQTCNKQSSVHCRLLVQISKTTTPKTAGRLQQPCNFICHYELTFWLNCLFVRLTFQNGFSHVSD
jgi:hypothetical protein